MKRDLIEASIRILARRIPLAPTQQHAERLRCRIASLKASLEHDGDEETAVCRHVDRDSLF